MKGFPGQDFQLVYDVCHNIAKVEGFGEAGEAEFLVHRKGATRAFPAGHHDLPEIFKSTGQPAIVPGDMGTASYVLAGTWKAMADTFGSICHGAGRAMGRNDAVRRLVGQETGKVNAEKVREGTKKIQEQLGALGIYVRYNGAKTLVEEYSGAYKDIDQVVATITAAGLANRVVRLRPIGVVKG
jgi:tRNA-splicing ligase RtcB